MPLYHLGVDDTDSLKYGCTTYVGAQLLERFRGCPFADYPNLVRLNPNVPWKSRGNAAICLRFWSDLGPTEILDIAEGIVDRYRDSTDKKNQPGIALLEGEVPPRLKEFGERALWKVLGMEEAQSVASGTGIAYRLIKGGRGLIGAVASIGNTMERDYTFELIVYRKRELWGQLREVDYGSVVKFDGETSPLTFNNIDPEEKRLLITPRGPDPILFGVRGEDPQAVTHALKSIRFSGAERWVLYRSNQGTDAHLKEARSVKDLRPYEAAVVEGTMAEEPQVLRGGHIIASLRDEAGQIDIAGYGPSGSFKGIVGQLMPGDRVRVSGGVRVVEGRLTLNLERLEALKLVTKTCANPICPNCGKSMKSEGKNKGYQCRRCGRRAAAGEMRGLQRGVAEGIYLPPPRAMRHLTKPPRRFGLEKQAWKDDIGEFQGFF
jgi:tRNA(Ile2)-agmatinylcytidine synthase